MLFLGKIKQFIFFVIPDIVFHSRYLLLRVRITVKETGKSSQHSKHCAVCWASVWGIDSNVLRYSSVMSFSGSHLELVFQSMVLEMIPVRHDLFTNGYKQQSLVKIHPAFSTHYKLYILTISRATESRTYCIN